MDRIRRSWELVTRSFAILRSNKDLLLLPIAGAVGFVLATMLIVVGTSVLIVAGAHLVGMPPGTDELSERSPWVWLAAFPALLGGLIVGVFFNVAFVAVASNRLSGGTWRLRDGLALAWERKVRVVQWALLSATLGATLGFVLRFLDRRSEAGGWGIRLFGLAWSLAAYFVIPVLAFEDVGPIDALKRSASLFRKTWGESVVAAFSIEAITTILPAGALVFLFFVGFATKQAILILLLGVLMLAYLPVSAVVDMAVEGIFVTALYRYATEHRVAPGFRPEHFAQAWVDSRKAEAGGVVRRVARISAGCSTLLCGGYALLVLREVSTAPTLGIAATAHPLLLIRFSILAVTLIAVALMWRYYAKSSYRATIAWSLVPVLYDALVILVVLPLIRAG